MKNKVPLVRSLTLNWVTFCIETSNKAVVLKLHKEYVPICMEVSELYVASYEARFLPKGRRVRLGANRVRT